MGKISLFSDLYYSLPGYFRLMEYNYYFVRHFLVTDPIRDRVYLLNSGSFTTRNNIEHAREPTYYRQDTRKAFVYRFVIDCSSGTDSIDLSLNVKVLWNYLPLVTITTVRFLDDSDNDKHYQFGYIDPKTAAGDVFNSLLWKKNINMNHSKGVFNIFITLLSKRISILYMFML